MSGRSELDIAAFKAALETEREELLAASAAMAAARAPIELDQQSVGRLSRMDAMQVQAMAKAQEARRQARLKAIELAFGRITAGEFGYCAQCGDDIPVKRLEIDPVMPRCIGCMEEG